MDWWGKDLRHDGSVSSQSPLFGPWSHRPLAHGWKGLRCILHTCVHTAIVLVFGHDFQAKPQNRQKERGSESKRDNTHQLHKSMDKSELYGMFSPVIFCHATLCYILLCCFACLSVCLSVRSYVHVCLFDCLFVCVCVRDQLSNTCCDVS